MSLINSQDEHSSSLRNHFLLAMPSLRESIFSQSITYICEHDEQGAMGIVINQPLELSLSEIFEHLQIKAQVKVPQVQIMSGGPVQIDHGFVLHRKSDREWEASLNVTAEITLTTSRDILQAIAQGDVENNWLTLPADGDVIFSTPYHLRHSAAAASLGVDMNLISAQAGHA
jgi:putative transcriptional regulator